MPSDPPASAGHSPDERGGFLLAALTPGQT